MIYIFFNEQPELVKRALNNFLRSYFPEKNDMNYFKADASEVSFREIVEEAYSLPLGEDKKVVVIENCTFLGKSGQKGKRKKNNSQSELDVLIDYCENPNMYSDLIFLYYSDQLDENNKLVNVIKNKGSIKQVSTPSENEWRNVVRRYFEKNKTEIDDDAVDEIVKRINGDYLNYLNDTNKLLNYANGERITLNIVRMLINDRTEFDVFSLCNYLIKGNIKACLSIYENLKKHSIDEITLIGTLTNQFKFMDQVLYLSRKGYGPDTIARELSTSPYRVKIILSNSLRNNSEDDIKKVLNDLYILSKNILSGGRPAEYSFKMFLLNYKGQN